MDRHQGLYDEVIYGLYGTRTTFALAEAVSELEGGCNTVITSSGTSAIALALTAFVAGGDHLLVADCVYGPTRTFRSEEHTSELPSLMRISYAVFCLKQTTPITLQHIYIYNPHIHI